MNSTTTFITSFMVWVGQFVVVSTVILVATHLIAKKRRELKRQARENQEQLPAEEQDKATAPANESEVVVGRSCGTQLTLP